MNENGKIIQTIEEDENSEDLTIVKSKAGTDIAKLLKSIEQMEKSFAGFTQNYTVENAKINNMVREITVKAQSI